MATANQGKWQEAAAGLHISHDELFSFHASHFSSSAVESFGSDFMNLSGKPLHSKQDVDKWEFEDDDSLGYYEDGVKRTLTDEQIKIFRHSELRELQRQQEHTKSAKPGGIENQNAVENRDTAMSASKPTTQTASGNRKKGKKKKAGRTANYEPKPDLRKRTWDVVDTGLDSLDYD